MHDSQYVTNQWCTNRSTWLIHQLEEDVGCIVLQFIQQWRSRSSLVTKPLAQRRSSFYREYDELGQIVSGHNMHVLSLCIKLHHLVKVLKIILIYVYGCEKRNSTQIFMDMHEVKYGNSNFVILDRYSCCRASTLNLDKYDYVEF